MDFVLKKLIHNKRPVSILGFFLILFSLPLTFLLVNTFGPKKNHTYKMASAESLSASSSATPSPFVFYDAFDTTSLNTTKWIKQDTSNNSILVNGAYEIGGYTNIWGNPAIYSQPSFTHQPGRTITAVTRSNVGTSSGPVILFAPTRFPINPPTSGYGVGYLGLNESEGQNLRLRAITPEGDFSYPQVANNNDYLIGSTLRQNGSYHFVTGGEFGTYPQATLIWVNDKNAVNENTLYAGIDAKKAASQTFSLKVIDLSAEFSSQNGLAKAVDTFTRANSTVLGNTESGNFAWTKQMGDSQISNGSLVRGGTLESLATFNSQVSEGIFEITFTTPNSTFADQMLYFRYQDQQNWWRFRCTPNTVHLEKMVGGVYSIPYQTGALKCNSNTTYRLTVRAHGSNLNVWLNNTSALFSDDGIDDTALQNATGVGIGFGENSPSPSVDQILAWPKTITLPLAVGPFPTVVKSGAQIIANDTFTGAVSTRLQNHTPETGGPWTEHGSTTWTVHNGVVTPSGCCGVATVDAGSPDMSVTTVINLANSAGCGTDGWEVGPVLRYIDGEHRIWARFLWQCSSPEIELWEISNGTGGRFLNAKNITGLVNLGEKHTLTAAVLGKKISVYLDGKLVLEGNTTVLTGSRAGILIDDVPNGVSSFDSFQVTNTNQDTIAPPPVVDLSVTSGTSSALLSWTPSVDDASGTQYYRVFRSTTAGIVGSQVSANGNPTSTNYTDTSLSTAGTYYYTVAAVDNAGNSDITNSNQVAYVYGPTGTLTTTPTTIPSPTVTPTPTPISTTTPFPTLTPTKTPTPSVTPVPENGLNGIYYNNINFTGSSITRIDPTIDFNWNTGSPNPAIAPNTFSARWTGFIVPKYTQRYTFYAYTDDGVRLYIDNVLIIDKWFDHKGEYSGQISLTANTRYSIRMDYYENKGAAEAHLRWSSPSQSKQIIPNSQLYFH